ncbi:AMP-dependent synthetase [Nocardioides marmoriginsengisoli]|uniref:AMP-dependent synthetase n=1 Tax=Nocardioides marmoriginsengisoli TaxID=661483 RepID=A0A3N0CF65_9ACTN|nr:AMP-binding protein [Nocardioides marmoriginsengisoli]RNL62100.1 AMP-dependent synthetase [Nocardioides marmoriginsengisoli]
MNLDYLPWRRAASLGDRPCVRDERQQLSYDQFASRVDAAAAQFSGLGVGPGSVVAVMLPNRVELLVSIVAAWRLGAAATPVNPALTAGEADHQIADSGAALVINLGPDAPRAGRTALAVDDLATDGGSDLPPASTGEGDLALLIYTSGSTGRPKGVMLSHGNLGSMARMMVDHIAITEGDHCLLVLPLFHANAICVSFLSPMLAGAQLSILAGFRPTEFLTAIETLRPTFFSAVPTIYSILANLPEDVVADTSSVRVAICGAAPAPATLLDQTERRFGFPMIEGYGLSEGTCASTCNPLDGPRKAGTVGVALPGQLVAVMGPDGELLPAGERGEVVIQGANVMQGYLNRPEETAETLGDGWLHTGDVGILDEDGYLRLVDRIKDLIIRGGENLYPKEIEAALLSHPGVVEAAVIGAPDPVYGEVPVAYVGLAPGVTVEVDALTKICTEQLTRVKVPISITILDSLPKNAVGKIDKPAVRAQHALAAAVPGLGD